MFSTKIAFLQGAKQKVFATILRIKSGKIEQRLSVPLGKARRSREGETKLHAAQSC